MTPTKAAAALLIIAIFAPALASAQPADLTRAYKREFAVLEAEKDALSARRNTVRAEALRNTRAKEAELARLGARLMALRQESEALDEELRRVGPEEDTSEADALIAQFAKRAHETFTAADLKAPSAPEKLEGEARAEHIAEVFGSVPALLEGGSALRKAPGSFFLEDGTRVDGQLIHIGKIATYGLSASASGALSPAGEGRLRLWRDDASASAEALGGGQTPASLRLFLHESLDKAVEPPAEKTALSIIQSGGTIAWIIVGLGGLALLLILLRALMLAFAGFGGERLRQRVRGLVEGGRVDEAVATCRKTRGPTARVLLSAVLSIDQPAEEQERAITEGLLHEVPRLERFGSALTVFAAVAPLLGLLGTVTGMIATFEVITEYGTGDPKLLSSGISEALVTTELGLIVAIPTLLIGSLLSARAEALISSLEHGALQVLGIEPAPAPPEASPERAGPIASGGVPMPVGASAMMPE